MSFESPCFCSAALKFLIDDVAVWILAVRPWIAEFADATAAALSSSDELGVKDADVLSGGGERVVSGVYCLGRVVEKGLHTQ